jgi:hypothetical protein
MFAMMLHNLMGEKPAQQAKSFLTTAEISSYEEDDEVYD